MEFCTGELLDTLPYQLSSIIAMRNFFNIMQELYHRQMPTAIISSQELLILKCFPAHDRVKEVTILLNESENSLVAYTCFEVRILPEHEREAEELLALINQSLAHTSTCLQISSRSLRTRTVIHSDDAEFSGAYLYYRLREGSRVLKDHFGMLRTLCSVPKSKSAREDKPAWLEKVKDETKKHDRMEAPPERLQAPADLPSFLRSPDLSAHRMDDDDPDDEYAGYENDDESEEMPEIREYYSGVSWNGESAHIIADRLDAAYKKYRLICMQYAREKPSIYGGNKEKLHQRLDCQRACVSKLETQLLLAQHNVNSYQTKEYVGRVVVDAYETDTAFELALYDGVTRLQCRRSLTLTAFEEGLIRENAQLTIIGVYVDGIVLIKCVRESEPIEIIRENMGPSHSDGFKEKLAKLSDGQLAVIAERITQRTYPVQADAPALFLSETEFVIMFVLCKDKLPAAIRQECEQQLSILRNQRLPGSEKTIALRVLRYCLNIDWSGRDRVFDLHAIQKALNKSHAGLKMVKEQLLDALAAFNINGKGVRLHLNGPVGTGKTSIARCLADALDIPCHFISLSGIHDVVYLNGSSRNYENGDAGVFLRNWSRAGTIDSVIVLNECDKVFSGEMKSGMDHGSVVHTLLDLTDDSGLYYDAFLEVPIDVSRCIIILTSNDASNVPAEILDRVQTVEIPAYTREETLLITKDYIMPAYARELRLDGKISIDEDAAMQLIDHYCPRGSLRDVKKAIARICNHMVRVSYKSIKKRSLKIDSSLIARTLNIPLSYRGIANTAPCAGTALALAVCGGLGESFPIEAMPDASLEALRITGLPSESVRDSCALAERCVHRYIQDLRGSFYIHFGHGAVKKDGPSAGICVFVAMLSAALGKAISPQAAFTGEIDLFGNVFAVGGIRSKGMAAAQTGCTVLYLPRANFDVIKKDELARGVQYIPVSTLDELAEQLFGGVS